MGNANGCYSLGFLYDNGQGVNQDYIKAAELFKKSCDMGYANGCYSLGLLYDNGQGVNQDYIQKRLNCAKKLVIWEMLMDVIVLGFYMITVRE